MTKTNVKTLTTVQTNCNGATDMTFTPLIEENNSIDLLTSAIDDLDNQTDTHHGDQVTLYQIYLFSQMLCSHPSISTTTEACTPHL